MQGKVEICGVNTARLKTLTHAEMDTLLRLAKAPMICSRWGVSA